MLFEEHIRGIRGASPGGQKDARLTGAGELPGQLNVHLIEPGKGGLWTGVCNGRIGAVDSHRDPPARGVADSRTEEAQVDLIARRAEIDGRGGYGAVL